MRFGFVCSLSRCAGPVLEYELFDLDADPFETENLYAKYADKSFLESLHTRVQSLYVLLFVP